MKTAGFVCKTVISYPDVSCLLFMFGTWSLIVECNALVGRILDINKQVEKVFGVWICLEIF